MVIGHVTSVPGRNDCWSPTIAAARFPQLVRARHASERPRLEHGEQRPERHHLQRRRVDLVGLGSGLVPGLAMGTLSIRHGSRFRRRADDARIPALAREPGSSMPSDISS
jgi:hypothetical protein